MKPGREDAPGFKCQTARQDAVGGAGVMIALPLPLQLSLSWRVPKRSPGPLLRLGLLPFPRHQTREAHRHMETPKAWLNHGDKNGRKVKSTSVVETKQRV
jgi:hypothetical protein